MEKEAEEEEGEKPMELEQVERRIGYKFSNSTLLKQAFTHSSYLQQQQKERDDEELLCSSSSYERLEYVGDSVLSLLMAKDDFLSYPLLPPGMLTRLRAANVDTEKLARAALHHQLHSFLRHNKPLLSAQIENFKGAVFMYPLHSNGLIDPPKVLADIVESLIGAIFIDSNFSLDTTGQVVKKLLQPIITPGSLQIHPMTKLYEICQKQGLKLEFVDEWEETGGFEVFVDGGVSRARPIPCQEDNCSKQGRT